MSGPIQDLEQKIEDLKFDKWIDNRTRAIFVEFSVYNAQVNLFGSVTAVSEFVGGGIVPWKKIESVRLFNNMETFWDFFIYAADILFAVSTFYYLTNVLATMKKEGFSDFMKNSWNVLDVFTLILSGLALILYFVKTLVVRDIQRRIEITRGNVYIRITNALLINYYHNCVVAFTVFTSTLKFLKFLAFHKAFMTISEGLSICFKGLATFVVEFTIVFVAFSSFFLFSLGVDLPDFRDIYRSILNCLAMSIGKFNFESLKEADYFAAWLFFAFSGN